MYSHYYHYTHVYTYIYIYIYSIRLRLSQQGLGGARALARVGGEERPDEVLGD